MKGESAEYSSKIGPLGRSWIQQNIFIVEHRTAADMRRRVAESKNAAVVSLGKTILFILFEALHKFELEQLLLWDYEKSFDKKLMSYKENTWIPGNLGVE